MNLGHCVICWESYDVCRCTEADHLEFDKKLEADQKRWREEERKNVHGLLDNSFNYAEKHSDGKNWKIYFINNLLSSLTRGKWLEIRSSFDKFYLTENEGKK